MDFKEIDNILTDIATRFEYNVLNPINKHAELKKFLKDKTYNPQFKYLKIDVDMHIKELQQLTIPTNTTLGKLFFEIKTKLLIEAISMKQIGTKDFNTTKLFSSVNESVIRRAKQILTEPSEQLIESVRNISSENLKQLMRLELDKYEKKNNWSIIFSEFSSARVSVNNGKKIVTIRKQELFSERDVKKLIVHEIGTHAVRSMNGEFQEYKIFSIGLPDYLATEEGLAGYNERTQGIKRHRTLRQYALSAIITHLCKTKSFVEVYNEIRKEFDEDEKCFRAITRSKRGMSDSSLPGGYLKDHCYLEGMMLIENFVKKGGDIKDLYAGKIGVQHLHLLKEGIIKPAKILPDFIK